jgi:RNA-binding protein
VVLVGSSGVTQGVIAAAAQALADHELIKVKFAADRDERQAAIDALVEGTGAELAQVLGKTALLFKKRKKKSKFDDLDLAEDDGEGEGEEDGEGPNSGP